jgi:hypothetical protein
MGRPDIRTVGDSLYWSYANLAMAHAAVIAGDSEYAKPHYAIRTRLFKGLSGGSMTVGSFGDDERIKMVLPQACCYCGSSDDLSLDHVVPRKVGGEDTGDNIVWACRACNSSKGAADLLTWMDSRREFPSLLLLRRYLKLVIQWCERNDFMHRPLGELRGDELPFALQRVPHTFPKPSQLRLWAVGLSEED